MNRLARSPCISRRAFIILTSPLFLLLLALDIIKIPAVFFAIPIWGTLETIHWAKGGKFDLLAGLWDFGTIGMQMYREMIEWPE